MTALKSKQLSPADEEALARHEGAEGEKVGGVITAQVGDDGWVMHRVNRAHPAYFVIKILRIAGCHGIANRVWRHYEQRARGAIGRR